MQPFLEKTAAYVYSRYGEDIHKLCIVLPNRRGGLFFRQYLSKFIPRPLFAPAVFSSEDFVTHLSGLQIAGTVDLCFYLYEAHLEIKKEEAEPFAEFVKWAGVLLSDFNEVDQYLVDARGLYKSLQNLKEIESWSLDAGDLTDFQLSYMRFWESLGPYYQLLQQSLSSKKQAYPGLAYKIIAENMDEIIPSVPWKKIIFAGFNALNRAEEKIIRTLLKENKAEILWDADTYYLRDATQEAGIFLREYPELFSFPANKSFNQEEDLLGSSPKKISIIGTPGNINQARVAGAILAELAAEGKSFDETALVLNDERLLFPVLHSLPDSVTELNVTMGFPLRHSPAAGLVEILFDLSESAKNVADAVLFYHAHACKLLMHPLVSLFFSGETSSAPARKIISHISTRNYIYISRDELIKIAAEEKCAQPERLNVLFFHAKDVNGFISHTELLLQEISSLYTKEEQNEEAKGKPEEELLFHLLKILKRIKDLSSRFNYLGDLHTLRVLFRQMLSQQSLPFYGEPLSGLQVMGMLETRTLDFKNVILLSVNENILPSPRTNHSFIPFDVKKAYGLPLYRDKDAVFAYHFYRLLQRAETVYLVYNTEQDLLGNGERSRFITQLIEEMPVKNQQVTITEKFLNPAASLQSMPDGLSVSKNPHVMEKLEKKAADGFSPTLLNSYINCSLQFYFQAVAGLEQPDEVEETIGADVLGSAIHEVLYKLYEPFLGKKITSAAITGFQKQVDELLKTAFSQFYNQREMTFGKNLLVYRIARQYILSFLEQETSFIKNTAQLPVILHLETKLESGFKVGGRNILLKGTVDRIDSVGDKVRIIDYKTGKTENREINLLDLSQLNLSPQYNKSFQLLTYSFLYSEQMGILKSGRLQAGIFSFRELSSGLKLLKIADNQYIESETLAAFKNMLSNIITEIFNPLVPFSQTVDTATCTYCTFKTICNR